MTFSRRSEEPIRFTFRVLGRPFPPVFAVAGCSPHDAIGDDGSAYRDVTVSAIADEVFADVVNRAAALLGVTALRGESVAASLVWIRFRETSDDRFDYDERLMWAQRMTVVDGEGRLRLDRRLDQFLVSDLLRAAELGLIDGDVHEPYLIPTIPQGGIEPWGLDWASLVGHVQLLWTALGAITTVDGTITMAQRIRARIKRAPEVLAERQIEGGGTPELLWDVFQHRPVLPADAAGWLNCSVEDVEVLLTALGLDDRGDGLWEPNSTDTARTMGRILLELRDRYSTGAHDERVLIARLKHVVETGERPPLPDPDAWRRQMTDGDYEEPEEFEEDQEEEVHEDDGDPLVPIDRLTLDCACGDPMCTVRTRLQIGNRVIQFNLEAPGDHIAVSGPFLMLVAEEHTE